MSYNAKRASGWRRLVGGIVVLSALLSGAVTGQESEAAPLGPHAEGEFASAPALVPTQAQKRFPLSQMPAKIALDRVAPARLNTETAAQPGKPGVPFKIGFSRDLLSLKNRAQTLAQLTWQSLPSGQIAALSVSSPEALGVRLGLLIENIPATALLRFYAQETDQVFEISGRTIMESVARNLAAGDTSDEARTYWSPLIDGAEMTVEIELPTGVSPDAVLFSIPRLSHLFVSPLNIRAWQEKIGESGSCNLDSTCYSSTWGNESLATARMAFNSGGGSYLCTGTLLNDSDASTVVPYFLSANHCISTQSEASSLQTYWFYRASSCNSGSLSSSTKTLVGGAALLYANSLTDTSFMRLNSTPPAGAWYSAWTASLPPLNTAVTGIHNPSGDLQKISFATITGYLKCPTTPGSSSYSCSSATSSSADHLKLVWNQGITEGGSSGSGLWLTSGSSHYLIGQLHGGSSYCSAPTAPDQYGRFDVAYNAALYQWLGATGTTGYALTVSKSGSGTVTSADGGINCGSTCSASFTSGAQVTLTATPASSFTGWSGACSGTSATCTLTMTAEKNVIASFNGALASQSITFGAAPSVTVGGKGSLSATGGASGQPVIFSSSTPSICTVSGSTVSGVAAGTCTIAANQAGNATYSAAPQVTQSFAIAAAPTYTLSVNSSGAAGVAVNASPTTYAGTTSYIKTGIAAGTILTLTAPTTAGSVQFSAWSGCDLTSSTTCTVTVNSAKSVTASYGSGTTGNLLQNPGFESGAVSWIEYASGGYPIVTTGGSIPPHSGIYNAWLGGYNSALDSLEQSVTIPANTSTANIEFWYRISTSETNLIDAHDTFQVDLYDAAGAKQTLATWSNLNATAGWVKGTPLDVSAYKGQTVRLRFTATTDISNITSFFIDDVSLTSTGNGNLVSQSITFGAAPSVTVGGTGSVSATGGASGQPVIFSSSTPSICTVSGSTVSGVGAGICTIAANQVGNATYSAAPQATLNFSITGVPPGPPTINSIAAGSRSATIYFSAPSNTGGSPIALYTATCTASGQTVRGATGIVSPLSVINLIGGVTYQCTLTATNSGGSSSSASGAMLVTAKKNSITPILMLLLD